jgi:hypothetical protein
MTTAFHRKIRTTSSSAQHNFIGKKWNNREIGINIPSTKRKTEEKDQRMQLGHCNRSHLRKIAPENIIYAI